MGRKGDQSDVLRGMGFYGSFRHIYFFSGSALRLDIEPLRPDDRVSFVFGFVHVFL